MTERADQLHHGSAPAHSTALVQAFLAKHHITQVCQPPLQLRFGSLRLLAFPKAKIARFGVSYGKSSKRISYYFHKTICFL
jgi:hypothetical protein